MTSAGFVKASANNLPMVNVFMMTEFIQNGIRFNVGEARYVKAARASAESYGDVRPELKVRSKGYSVSVTVNETKETIKYVKCNDCAASERKVDVMLCKQTL